MGAPARSQQTAGQQVPCEICAAGAGRQRTLAAAQRQGAAFTAWHLPTPAPAWPLQVAGQQRPTGGKSDKEGQCLEVTTVAQRALTCSNMFWPGQALTLPMQAPSRAAVSLLCRDTQDVMSRAVLHRLCPGQLVSADPYYIADGRRCPIGCCHTGKVPVHAQRRCLAAASNQWPVKHGITLWVTTEVCAELVPMLGQATVQAELVRQAGRAPQADQQLLPDVRPHCAVSTLPQGMA